MSWSFSRRLPCLPLHATLRHGEGKGRIPVTVCVAAICDGNTILGASDRMLTSADVEFEPAQSKIVGLTNSIAIMIAGDSASQMEIIYNVQADVNKRIEAEPQRWWNIRDVANLYASYYNQLRVRQSENAILAPLGLDIKTFISEQKNMDDKLVNQLATELINFNGPVVEAIFTGVDSTGAHIYVARNSNVQCQDAVGFAAIGVGYWHANSQFMFAGHTRLKPVPETLLLTYSAKKRAEVAPGVGEGTDMFTIGPILGSYTLLRDDVLFSLEKMYQRKLKKEHAVAKLANSEVNKYVQDIIKAATAKEQAANPKDDVGNQPPDKKEVEQNRKEVSPTKNQP